MLIINNQHSKIYTLSNVFSPTLVNLKTSLKLCTYACGRA